MYHKNLTNQQCQTNADNIETETDNIKSVQNICYIFNQPIKG